GPACSGIREPILDPARYRGWRPPSRASASPAVPRIGTAATIRSHSARVHGTAPRGSLRPMRSSSEPGSGAGTRASDWGSARPTPTGVRVVGGAGSSEGGDSGAVGPGGGVAGCGATVRGCVAGVARRGAGVAGCGAGVAAGGGGAAGGGAWAIGSGPDPAVADEAGLSRWGCGSGCGADVVGVIVRTTRVVTWPRCSWG